MDQSFGTGCVKVTPAHDFNDDSIGKRHGLAYYNILTADGHLNEQVPSDFQGLERFAARKAVLKALESSQQLIKTQPHTHKIPYGDRSNVVIEPWLTDQWFNEHEKHGTRCPTMRRSRKNSIHP